MKTREAIFSDLPSISDLFGQLGYPTELAELERRWLTPDPAGERWIVVAELEQVIAGVLVLNYIAPLHEPRLWAVISALVVDNAHRNQGVGKHLLVSAEQHAIRRGCVHIELASSENRIEAHRFYSRHGFNEVRKRLVKKLPLDA